MATKAVQHRRIVLPGSGAQDAEGRLRRIPVIDQRVKIAGDAQNVPAEAWSIQRFRIKPIGLILVVQDGDLRSSRGMPPSN